MLSIPPPKFRSRRRAKARPVSVPTPPITGPVMSDGDFDSDKSELTVEFDQDVSDAGFVPAAVTVNDPVSGSMYRATGASVFASVIVVFEMEAIGASSGSQTWMNATGANGIVSASDGAMWAGVTELALPFP